ncbi:hypothetical protein SDRG_07881 [Saprolegnia diclina VS20]|uniref:Strawberry notch AAA domain-containing protein n=1 Tax=Saprolegnia diclina (strain VS20) TaxID=1156394 RepID=T0QL81_SAPDV|nr:hypothetical protein SDRG_07881 [Saprolegnia diclina VS20]EQC34555.1 hypothetical protein SDRG_07881 [Saprolegnia diclina VS20]|eukprot:XP_008611961.1 hypothetical protein SDRG_07881 [Saprolegnia diclina VS20]
MELAELAVPADTATPPAVDATPDDAASQDNATHAEDIVFSAYACKSLDFGQPHPGNISESALLATAPLPPCEYNRDAFPDDLVDQGKLTSLQLEGILYACMQHQKILPTGERCGFFLGDGTGVGKGRQLAGIIFDNLCRGRKKHLWFSVSNDLRADAERDLRDIGCHVAVIDGCQQLDKASLKGFGQSSNSKQGVLYSTYSTLTSNLAHPTKSRLAQIVGWCGDNFEGCILFDECHKAKHGDLSMKDATASKVATAVAKIQELLPRARVVYCSATGVGGIEHMAYMGRLGLWGPRTAFAGFSDFLYTIQNKGMGAMEMLAIEMKLQGKYLSRGLSYEGAEFRIETVVLDDAQEAMYDRSVQLWTMLMGCFHRACAITRTSGDVMKTFWGCHQRFFRQLCMALKVPFIVKCVQESLALGQCAVIGLQTTGEASMERSVAANLGTDKTLSHTLVSLLERILIDFIELHFPTKVQLAASSMSASYDISMIDAALAGDADSKMERLPDGSLQSVLCVEMRAMLLRQVLDLQLPPNPLDHLIDALGGVAAVAELTGRRLHVVRNARGNFETKPRGVHLDKVNMAERQAFMDGTKLVAIISDAASTGISLHADRRCRNQRRRIHITLELPWSADKAIQQLGRTHRSNQSCAPSYALVTTNCGGENRFVASVAKKMLTMGALTKGDRRAGSGQDFSGYHFETKYGFQALRELLKVAGTPTLVEGVDGAALLAQTPFVSSLGQLQLVFANCLKQIGLLPPPTTCAVKLFLNRLLGLSPMHQNALFLYFEKCLQAVIAKATQEGKYDEGYDDIKGRKGQLQRQSLLSPTVQHSHVEVDRGISYEEATTLLASSVAAGYSASFYISDTKFYGEYLFMLMLVSANKTSCCVVRPNTGYLYFDRSKLDDMRDKYAAITPAAAEKGWRRIFDESSVRCVHWNGCKAGLTCRVGMRMMQYHVLTGSVLPIWKLLEAVLLSSPDVSPSSQLRIVRIALTNHPTQSKLVGLSFPVELIGQLHVELTKLASGHSLLAVEAPSPVDCKARDRLMQPERTLLSYFGAGAEPTPKRHKPDSATKLSNTATVVVQPRKTSATPNAASTAAFFAPKSTTRLTTRMAALPTASVPAVECIDLVSDDDDCI